METTRPSSCVTERAVPIARREGGGGIIDVGQGKFAKNVLHKVFKIIGYTRGRMLLRSFGYELGTTQSIME